MTGYKPSSTEKRKRTNHLFVNFQKDLNLSNFLKSDLDLKIEKVNNDTYLKVFEHNLFPSPVLQKTKIQCKRVLIIILNMKNLISQLDFKFMKI